MQSLKKCNDRDKYKFTYEDDMDDLIVNTYLEKLESQRKRRACLMCGNIFDSSGPFNRRCPNCTRLVNKDLAEFNMPYVHKVHRELPD